MDLVKDLYNNGKLYRLSMDPNGIDISGENQILKINSDKITGDLNIDGNIHMHASPAHTAGKIITFSTATPNGWGNAGYIDFCRNGSSTPYGGGTYSDYRIQGGETGIKFQKKNLSIADTNLITITDNGYVGIGTTHPEQKLHVNDGNISCTGTDPNIYLGPASTSSTTANSLRLHYTSNNAFIDYNNTTTGLQLRNGNFTTMTLDAANNVGIGITNPTCKLEVNGRIKVPQNELQDGTNIGGVIPSGGIIMWHGSTVPSGWALCDGGNGTPDLRNRFIRGGTTSQVNQKDGNDKKTLSLSNMPTHNHSASSNETGAHTHSINNGGGVTFYNNHGGGPMYPIKSNVGGAWGGNAQSWGSHSHGMSEKGEHSHTITVENSGSGSQFDIKPAYYVLAFIMKL